MPRERAADRATFLRAEWRHLAILNYRVDPGLLAPYVPRGTTLDLWNGAAYVSVVGFMFLNTRILGLPIPFHRNFPEINLRFYVRRTVGDEVRRAVTFIRELVPRRAIALTARRIYNEPYLALPMRHRTNVSPAGASVDYEWQSTRWGGVHVSAVGTVVPIEHGSEAEFIAEHYWGYTAQADGSTIEYRVRHPRWSVWTAQTASLDGDIGRVYPPQFTSDLERRPDSAFIADGSAISVEWPIRLA